MIKKVLTGAAGAVGGVGWCGGPSVRAASDRDAGVDVVLPFEPNQGLPPGESDRSASWNAVRGLHPLHWEVHGSPGEEERQIMVVVSAQECP